MSKLQPLPHAEWHDSMRGFFAGVLYNAMLEDPRIILLTGDLGYGMFDRIRSDFPDRFINTGAAEQAMMGIAVGLAMEGKIPVVYSITPFLLYRPFETIRNYIDHEKIPVILAGSGRDRSYAHDGFSHYCEEAREVMKLFPNINTLWPDDKAQIPNMVDEMLKSNQPYFISLIR